MTRTFFFCLIGIFLLYCVAILAIASYYQPINSINYATQLTPALLAHAMARVDLSSFRSALDHMDLPLLVGCSLAFVVFASTMSNPTSVARSVVLLAQLLIVWPGWTGVLMLLLLPFHLSFVLVGEFLGEHWPAMIVQGLWLVVSVTLAAINEYTRRGQRHVAA